MLPKFSIPECCGGNELWLWFLNAESGPPVQGYTMRSGLKYEKLFPGPWTAGGKKVFRTTWALMLLPATLRMLLQ